MPNTSTLSKYLKAEHVADGDVITFSDAGIIVEKAFKKDGKDEKRHALEITVKFHGQDKIYTPNGTTIKLLTAAWGPDTEDWQGNQAVLTVVPSPNGKDMLIAKPK